MAKVINIGAGGGGSDYELLTNKTTTIDENSTDTQYPSAKAVYDLVSDNSSGGDGIELSNVTNASTSSARSRISLTWTDPSDITLDGATLARWAGTLVIRKEGSAPSDESDGVIVIDSTSRNAYSSTAFVDSGLTDGVTYYYGFYPYTKSGTYSEGITLSATPARQSIAVPTVSGTLTYNGNSQTPSWSGYDSTKMTLVVIAQVNAGNYTASFTPTEDYQWSDGSTSAKSVNWSIGRADAITPTLSKTSITLNSTTPSTTFTVTRSGDGAITATSSDTSVATTSVSGTTVTVRSVNDTNGTATITVKVNQGTNYTAYTGTDVTCAVTASFVSNTLNDNSWDTISSVAQAGTAGSYWSVGDCKSVALNGTMGTLSLNTTLWVYIIGINHRSTNGVTFQGFKTAQTSGKDVCLTDDYYNSGKSDGTKTFNINHWGGSSLPYNTNYGGWAACDMRYDILGSTNVAPSSYGSTKTTSATGSNPTNTCATSPVSNTLMSCLPSALRAVMRPMTVYTDNKGNSSNTAANVTTTTDYLPLLAEFEIFGARTYANQYEKDNQTQYAYYSSGNSKVKYQHSSTGSTAYWWERSPCYNGANSFCGVNTNGYASNNTSRYSFGVAPAFMV